MNYFWYLPALLMLLLSLSTQAQDKAAYKLYSSTGKALSYKKALKLLSPSDVICFGELHNNPIAHWLQLELLLDLHDKKGSKGMAVGAEMFERDRQELIDAYFNNKIEADSFEKQARHWPNYDTDYKPILEYCRQKGIPLIATNVPRKYARIVARQGQEALAELPDVNKDHIAPLPYPIDYELPSYQTMMEMMGGHNSPMKPKNFVAAQAIKDATMAHFILQNKEANQLFYHLNGAYHSDSKEGIVWYLKQAQPNLKITNLSCVEQEDISKLKKEHKGKADVIIAIPQNMTKTY